MWDASARLPYKSLGQASIKWANSLCVTEGTVEQWARVNPKRQSYASQARMDSISWANGEGGGPCASAKYFRPIRIEFSQSCFSTADLAFKVKMEWEVMRYFWSGRMPAAPIRSSSEMRESRRMCWAIALGPADPWRRSF